MHVYMNSGCPVEDELGRKSYVELGSCVQQTDTVNAQKWEQTDTTNTESPDDGSVSGCIQAGARITQISDKFSMCC